MAAITGIDPISLSILKSLSSGTKVKDIPALFDVSLDQAKRLSRYHNLLKQADEHLCQSLFIKCQEIGLKTLFLAPLFKNQDWEGVGELLSVISSKTTTEQIKALLSALEEKRKRIEEFQMEVNRKLKSLTYKEQEVKKSLEETKNIHYKIILICQQL